MKTRTKGSEGKRCEECCGQEKKVRPRFFVQTFFFFVFLKKKHSRKQHQRVRERTSRRRERPRPTDGNGRLTSSQ